MNKISEQLLQAMEIMTDRKISRLQYDRTIQAKIYSIVNLDRGEYKVKYNENIFSVYAADLTKTYAVGDWVYVLVPENNFSNRKSILGKASDQSLTTSEMTSLMNSITVVSPTFDAFYGYDKAKEYGVVAGATPGAAYSQDTIMPTTSRDGYHGLFQQYANNYEYIRISASFLTRFHCEHTAGNYGIEIVFYTKSDGEVSYRLDLNSFNGDPYHYSVFSPQSVVIQVQKNYLTGVKSITLFEEGFEYDHYVKNGVITDDLIVDIPNIFVRDVEIQYVEKRDLTDTSYYLTIAAPQGHSINATVGTINLVARLIYQGKDILNASKHEIQWYERDLSVMVGDDEYAPAAGIGWKAIDGATGVSLSLDAENILHEGRYKVVVNYNSIALVDECEVFNLNSGYNYELRQVTSGDDISLQLVNNVGSEVLVGDWYFSQPDGTYAKITEGNLRNSIDINDYLIYSAVTFYCAVYNYAGTQVIGTLEYVVTNSSSEDDITIEYDGEDTFRYDANGDITIEDSEKGRTLQVKLTWRDGVGTSYRVEWLGPDGSAITSTKQSPAQSMIDNLWIDSNNVLHYNIKQKYRVNYNNNTITVRIVTVDEQVYTFRKEILFLKDGDQGTNGTTYVVAIRPYNTSTGEKLSGFQPLLYNLNGSQSRNNLPLRCYVYKDGDLINSNTNYVIEYAWTGVNVALTTNGDRVSARGTSVVAATSPASALEFYVKVQVTINDNTNGRVVDVYTSYPIDVLVGNLDATLVDIESIPSYIKYTASGTTPSFYSNNVTFTYNSVDYTGNIASVNTKILELQARTDGARYLRPASSFIFEKAEDTDSNIGVLKCSVSSAQFIIHPIVMYLDAYGNEAINGWDGTALDTGDGAYVFAPQVGAGEKDSANRFTGVVMGKDSARDQIGLYGYRNGVNTYGLMADGTAFFGAKSGGGQIVINGTSAMITGGDATASALAANGMRLTFADKSVDGTGKAIQIGRYSNSQGMFDVAYDGTVIANSATIRGTIYATEGYIGCSSRYSTDGWHIATGKLESGSGSRYLALSTLSSDDYFISAGSGSKQFTVNKDGSMIAKIGYIGNWVIRNNSLTTDSYKIGMAASGVNGTIPVLQDDGTTVNQTKSLAFWSGGSTATASDETVSGVTFTGGSFFAVDRSGYVYCKGAYISGKINATSGKIGGWTISSSGLSNGDNIYLRSNGSMKVGSNFSVSSSGKLTAKNAEFSGTISGATISAGTISGADISGGTISGTTISGGTIKSGNATISGGTISGATISGGIVTGATIRGGKYYNTEGTAHIEVGNASYGDFYFRTGNGNNIFQIYDNVGVLTLKSFGNNFLNYNAGIKAAYAIGAWNFGSATVTGLTVPATFG